MSVALPRIASASPGTSAGAARPGRREPPWSRQRLGQPVGVLLLLLGEQPRDRLGAAEPAAVDGGRVREDRLPLERDRGLEDGDVALRLGERVPHPQQNGTAPAARTAPPIAMPRWTSSRRERSYSAIAAVSAAPSRMTSASRTRLRHRRHAGHEGAWAPGPPGHPG